MVAANEVYELDRADFIGPVRVKFGPGKTQDVPVEWAAVMLTGLLEKNANLFRDLLLKAATEAKLCLRGVSRRGKETGRRGGNSAR